MEPVIRCYQFSVCSPLPLTVRRPRLRLALIKIKIKPYNKHTIHISGITTDVLRMPQFNRSAITTQLRHRSAAELDTVFLSRIDHKCRL